MNTDSGLPESPHDQEVQAGIKKQNSECLETKQGLGKQLLQRAVPRSAPKHHAPLVSALQFPALTLSKFLPYQQRPALSNQEAFLSLAKDLKVIIEVFFIPGSLIPFQALMSPKNLCYTDLALLNIALLFAQKSQKCPFFFFRKKQKPIPPDTQNPFLITYFIFSCFRG